MDSPLSIIFMGTPDFAVPSLTALHEADFDIRLVVTQPDRPKGRGRKMVPAPVKSVAQAMGLDVYQPGFIRASEAMSIFDELAPDLFVVVAFGQILTLSLLKIPKHGAINLHASLLPKYRGPAPIQWAIMRGEKETGVTTMLMDQGVDTGDLLLQRKCPISMEDTAETLHKKLSDLGADLLVETLQLKSEEQLLPITQDHSRATYAPLMKKQDGRIDWHLSALKLDAFIRAMTPWPGAFCFFDEKRIRIIKAQPLELSVDSAPGTIIAGFPDELRIATGKGQLVIQKLQGASGKILETADFLRGHPLNPGAVFH